MRRMMSWLPAGLALMGVASGLLWWSTGAASVSLRVPGADRVGAASEPAVDLRGELVRGAGEAGSGAGAWPGFRGVMGTGVSGEMGLLKDVAQAKALWQAELGEGYAGPAVRAGRVYVLDYDAVKRADTLRCLSTDDGREIWRHAYGVDVKRNHGMSRTVPAVDEAVAVTLGPRCQVVAVDAESGEFLWGKDLVREYGTRVPPWYAGQCPLLREGRVYLAPAGEKVLLTALDAKTGATVWETSNSEGWTMTHSSIAEVDVEGRATLVYCGSGGVMGVDRATGAMLWESTAWKVGIATVPTPVDLGGGRILFTGGYGAGAMIGRVVRNGERYELVVEKRMAAGVMGSEQQTPVRVGEGVVAVIAGGEMVWMGGDGEIRWRSGAAGGGRFGSGSYLVADGAVYAVNDTGMLTTVAADGGGFKVLGSRRVLMAARECWGPMALADGRLYVRDLTRMVCLDVRGAR